MVNLPFPRPPPVLGDEVGHAPEEVDELIEPRLAPHPLGLLAAQPLGGQQQAPAGGASDPRAAPLPHSTIGRDLETPSSCSNES